MTTSTTPAPAPPAAVTFSIALPPKCLSPNNAPATSKGHMYKRSAYRRCRGAAELSCMVAMKGPPPRWEKATAQATFYFRLRRKRDQDNLGASLKAVWDGVARSGLIANDVGLTPLPPRTREGVNQWEQRVEITITRSS